MRVALVSAYDYAHPGGVTEHVRHLAAGLRRRGHEGTVFAPSSARVSDQDADFVRVGRPFPIPTHGSVARITVSFHLMNRIKHYVRDSGFDVIHYHEPLMPILPVTALRFSETCNVGTFHAFARSNVGYYYGKPLLKRQVRRLHARIAVSNPARDFVERYFPGEYRIVPNGIDVERFRHSSPMPEFSDGMVNILFVGRLEYRKGLGYLLRAYEQLKPLYPNLRLIIAGDGPLPDEEVEVSLRCQALAEALAALGDRERQVLILRYGLDDAEPKTLEDIGRRLGLTRERVRQIETEALKRLARLREMESVAHY